MNKYREFLEKLINEGVEGARDTYKNDPAKLKGSVAGFELCRGKTVPELAGLLNVARKNTQEAFGGDTEKYWEIRCQEAEIEYVCNCLSATVESELQIVSPTARGFMRANEIIEQIT